ncbi:hypothetical protein DVH24_032660 [Malus domestica]|uniref:Uncharacterized protein n=1 Tax=Malus domestica TaxID=3750 RepID=A0A498J908_MALDO|nr:hypothetical protein DVH24_032660 [Malus domestica]
MYGPVHFRRTRVILYKLLTVLTNQSHIQKKLKTALGVGINTCTGYLYGVFAFFQPQTLQERCAVFRPQTSQMDFVFFFLLEFDEIIL